MSMDDPDKFIRGILFWFLINTLILFIFLANVEANEKLITFINSSPKTCVNKITSLKRSKEHNHRVGGSKTSMHLIGKAVDVVTNCRDYFVAISRSQGVSVIKYKTHLHFDLREHVICLEKTVHGFKFCIGTF